MHVCGLLETNLHIREGLTFTGDGRDGGVGMVLLLVVVMLRYHGDADDDDNAVVVMMMMVELIVSVWL